MMPYCLLGCCVYICSEAAFTCDQQAILEMELGHLLVQGRLMVLQAVSFIHHHVVPFDLIQNCGIFQNQLICCDDHLHATWPCKLMAEFAVPIVCANMVQGTG